jgi:hypothetical protein
MDDFLHFLNESPILATLLVLIIGGFAHSLWARSCTVAETMAHRICGTIERIHKSSKDPLSPS